MEASSSHDRVIWLYSQSKFLRRNSIQVAGLSEKIIGDKYAHAKDHEKCRTIIFNIDQKQLLYILGNDCITRLYYSSRKLADEYIQLFAYVDNQLPINKAKHQTTGHYINSANAYIQEHMNISNLKGIDANSVP